MKKNLFFSVPAFLLFINVFSQSPSLFHSTGNGPSRVTVLRSTAGETELLFTLGDVYSVDIPGTGKIFRLDEGTPIEQKDAPDLPKFTASIVIPDLAGMQVEVLEMSETEYTGIWVAPSKGTLTRNIDPASIPYTAGSMYEINGEFPGETAALQAPYILRDFRAQTVIFYPLQYNPVTGTLRIYNTIHVKVSVKDAEGPNPLIRTGNITSIEKEFHALYSGRFVNYNDVSRYTPVEENGSMLIISDPAFVTAMQPLADWKTERGLKTEMVTTTVTGTTSGEIKAYVEGYYAAHPELKYLLLVGDAAQVPPQAPNGMNGLAGHSDIFYGYLVGDDAYPEIFVGRFSAETVDHVRTMVDRTLTYEKNPDMGDWYGKGIGLASNQGPGDDNEMDFEHEQNLRSVLMSFTYTAIDEMYDGSQGNEDAGGDPNAYMVVDAVNDGRGIINYTGHGWNEGWATSGFSNTEITFLTNVNKLPFIWSVGCVNGEFMNVTCFGEQWTRMTDVNGQPVGAIATLMSTINQYWNQPMEGQDEMVDLLAEAHTSNIKRTFGGISMNGCMKMNDAYGSSGDDMTDTWALFGDPSLMVRTAQPQVLTAVHVTEVQTGTAQATVNCNVENAFICLSMNGQILGTGTVSGGHADITFPALTAEDTITVTATAFNYKPYQGMIRVRESFTGVEDNAADGFSLYPNPAADQITIGFGMEQEGQVSYQVTDVSGRTILRSTSLAYSSGVHQLQLDASAWAAGTYRITLHAGERWVTKSVVVR